jgi:hypothetical protein
LGFINNLLFRRPPRLHGPVDSAFDELHLGLAGLAAAGDASVHSLERPCEILYRILLRLLRNEALRLAAGGESAIPFGALGGSQNVEVEVVS